MALNYSDIPQSVFPTQRDDEKVFVITRRHLISFVVQGFILFLLILVPIVFLFLSYSQTISVLASFPVVVDDMIILILAIYYLALITLFMIYFMNYYHSILVVTNRRIYQVFQRGLFSRDLHEFALEEIEEATFKSRGIIGLIFNFGDLSIHFRNQEENYEIHGIPGVNVVAFVVSSLIDVTEEHTSSDQVKPALNIIGVIDRKVINKNDQPKPIMNFSQSIKQAQQQLQLTASPPKGLRDKFDLWWWTQLKKEHAIYIDYSPTKLSNIAKKKEGKIGKASDS